MNAMTAHLEAVFDAYPQTTRVLEAKAELQAMMDDAYESLIATGVTPSDAAGRVISEFGNLDDVAPTLGLATETDRAAGGAGATPATKPGGGNRIALIVLVVLAVLWLGVTAPPLVWALFAPVPGWLVLVCGVIAGFCVVSLIILIRLLRR
ncbi:permease prefix domain 1-containing protein [Microbacterium jiangjiandongii]|uniref:permease prefix domain 1-containing protein n=1 Tax=Microbacterium jiangjiandongii TaxID=3049071 RepID=UPI00214BD249|nr:permease prefix domain 1-containing protein [Microbacterium sp. zg.Y843]MCR2816634.1 permease prefix domain 1-containing protein [Microbacterium sp. zg.Y843]